MGAHGNAGNAKAALQAAGVNEGLGDPFALKLGQSFERLHTLAGNFAAGTTQETTALSSTKTVQHPHEPWGLQPFFAATRSKCSRKTSSRESLGATRISRGSPLRMN
jgi:hypothetical protein